MGSYRQQPVHCAQCLAVLIGLLLLSSAASRLSLCQVRSHGLMEAFCSVIGGSIRHSALGTLAALIRSLGLLTSQGRMLQQNTDQMMVPCFVGTCKGGGRRQRKSICLVSAAPEVFSLHLCGAYVSLLLPHKCSNVHRSSFVV
ncbi:hypothetical protein NQZ68_016596 [Dissostichus eleginoides]|nr:hypothetical protein NQZ68_016596 [Dissostichus eleginoides]